MSAPVVAEPLEKVEPPKVTAGPAFSSAEQESFHSEDRRAAATIVCIMLAIFAAAVIGYSCVAYLAHSYPG